MFIISLPYSAQVPKVAKEAKVAKVTSLKRGLKSFVSKCDRSTQLLKRPFFQRKVYVMFVSGATIANWSLWWQMMMSSLHHLMWWLGQLKISVINMIDGNRKAHDTTSSRGAARGGGNKWEGEKEAMPKIRRDIQQETFVSTSTKHSKW